MDLSCERWRGDGIVDRKEYNKYNEELGEWVRKCESVKKNKFLKQAKQEASKRRRRWQRMWVSEREMLLYNYHNEVL